MERLELFGKICDCGGNIERIAFMVSKPFVCNRCYKAYSHEDLKYIEKKPIKEEFLAELNSILKKEFGLDVKK